MLMRVGGGIFICDPVQDRKDIEFCYRQGNMKDNIVKKRTNKVYAYHEKKVIKLCSAVWIKL